MSASAFPRIEAYDRLVRLPEVMYLTGFGRSTIYRKHARDEFPRPVKIGSRFTAWRLSDINRWLQAVKDAGDGPDRDNDR